MASIKNEKLEKEATSDEALAGTGGRGAGPV
jgi:hypothetical protein